MKARLIYESPPPTNFIAIIQEGRFTQMVGYLMSLAERAALAAEREAAKAKAKPKTKNGKRSIKKRRARRE